MWGNLSPKLPLKLIHLCIATIREQGTVRKNKWTCLPSFKVIKDFIFLSFLLTENSISDGMIDLSWVKSKTGR